jgi:hypothetical protein
MCNFKAGQTVVRVEGFHMGMAPGAVGVVKSVAHDGITLEEYGGVHDDVNFALYVVAPVKKITVDVCHRLVAYDCEIVNLQAQVENLREDFSRQLAQLEGTIDTLTTEMNTLKSEYNVE